MTPQSDNLTPLEWQPDLETGDLQIDNEHRNLFKLCNNIINEITHDDPTIEHIQQYYDELVDYVDTHLEHEEALMHRIGFPKLAADCHKESHNDIRHQVADTSQLSHNPKVMGYYLVSIIRPWIMSHIMQFDLALSLYTRLHENDNV